MLRVSAKPEVPSSYICTVVENGGKKKGRCVLPNVLVVWLQNAQETLLCKLAHNNSSEEKSNVGSTDALFGVWLNSIHFYEI